MGRRTQNHPDRPKLCPACGEIKPPSEFYVTKYGTLYTDCKACLKAYKAEMWREKYKSLGRKTDSVIR